MKFKTTARAIREGYQKDKTFSTGYCTLQHILYWESPRAYTAGVYGWNFDLHEIDGYAICTGYRGMVGRDIPDNLAAEYDERALKVLQDNTRKGKKDACKALFIEMMQKVEEAYNKKAA